MTESKGEKAATGLRRDGEEEMGEVGIILSQYVDSTPAGHWKGQGWDFEKGKGRKTREMM